MQVIITAVGPDNRGLADPIVHYVTTAGANISEIQMYDHDSEHVFAMFLRADWPIEVGSIAELRSRMQEIGRLKNLSIRVWSPFEHQRTPRLAICTTFRTEPPLAVLRAVRDGRIRASVPLMVGNRPTCRGLAEQFDCDWHSIDDGKGNPDNDRMIDLFDEYQIDYIILARYMRVLPASTCWRFAGGRIVNLHHGLLPSFPGPRPYEDAYGHHMLTYGATIHFIVPELDAGNQIIYQGTFTVSHGTSLDEIKRVGQSDNEPACLCEGVRRVVDQEVALKFHRVVRAHDKKS